MSDFSTVVAALELVVGQTKAVEILKGMEADNSRLADELAALTNKSLALEAALVRSQARAMELATAIQAVREDAADGVLDNPVPDPIPDPLPVVVDPTPVAPVV
jgi:hypothetical protein